MIRLRWISLRAVKLQGVVQASRVPFVGLVAHWCMTAAGDPSSHPICSVTCSRYPVSLRGMVRLPGLGPVLQVRDLEIGSFLVPYLLRFCSRANIRFDDIAIRLILQIQIMMRHALFLIVELVVRRVRSGVVSVIVFLNLFCDSSSPKEAIVGAEGRASVLPVRGGRLLCRRRAGHSPLEALASGHVSLQSFDADLAGLLALLLPIAQMNEIS